jgi:2-polyprenyl-3-methyl-5-hydroxy-6-metoxy-1,4-benzoquinol methylase
MKCPVCASDDQARLYPVHEGKCLTSDFQIIENCRIENVICQACGFTFNAAGVRGKASDFYNSSYSLRMHTKSAQNMNFSASGAKPLAQSIFEFLSATVPLSQRGTLLEAGAGKGVFLRHFSAALPGWRITAFEPSPAAEDLARGFPEAEVHRCGFEDAPVGVKFDVVASLAVIEHVDNPVTFLRWLADRMAPDGNLLLTFPDFARNPNDLFCVDHLSKISGLHLERLAFEAGLEVKATAHVGVTLLAVLTRASSATLPPTQLSAAEAIAAANTAIAKSTIESIAEARRQASSDGSGFGIFGLGLSGVVAPFFLDFPHAEIAAYIDENETMQGSEIAGRPVVSLEAMAARGIKHVALSISPIYRPQVKDKLAKYGVRVYD